MKRKTIDTMREIRLWTCQVIVPAFAALAAFGSATLTIPEVRESANNFVKKFKDSRQTKK